MSTIAISWSQFLVLISGKCVLGGCCNLPTNAPEATPTLGRVVSLRSFPLLHSYSRTGEKATPPVDIVNPHVHCNNLEVDDDPLYLVNTMILMQDRNVLILTLTTYRLCVIG